MMPAPVALSLPSQFAASAMPAFAASQLSAPANGGGFDALMANLPVQPGAAKAATNSIDTQVVDLAAEQPANVADVEQNVQNIEASLAHLPQISANVSSRISPTAPAAALPVSQAANARDDDDVVPSCSEEDLGISPNEAMTVSVTPHNVLPIKTANVQALESSAQENDGNTNVTSTSAPQKAVSLNIANFVGAPVEAAQNSLTKIIPESEMEVAVAQLPKVAEMVSVTFAKELISGNREKPAVSAFELVKEAIIAKPVGDLVLVKTNMPPVESPVLSTGPAQQFSGAANNVQASLSVNAADPTTLVAERVLDLARNNLWLDQLASDIVATTDNDRALSFRLVPAQLGQLDVRIENRNEGMQIQFTAQTTEATRIVSSAQPQLLEELRNQGMRAVGSEVLNGSDTATGSQNNGFAQQNGQRPHAAQQAEIREKGPVSDQTQPDGGQQSGRFA